MRVAVIGAGIVGVTTAYELAADGHAVTVFDRRGSVAEEASFASAGLSGLAGVLNAAPMAGPGMPGRPNRGLWRNGAWLKWHPLASGQWRWLWRHWRASSAPDSLAKISVLVALARHSQQRLAALTHGLGLSHEQAQGMLWLYRTPAALAAARTELKLLAELGVTFHLVSAERARTLEPGLNPQAPLHAAIHLQDESIGNCRQFAHRLRAEAERLGANFRFHRQVLALTAGAAPTVQHRQVDHSQPAQTDSFDAVVVCAALDSAGLLAPLGLRLPMAAVHGYSLTAPLRQLEGFPNLGPRAAVVDAASRLTITRLGQRVRVAGGTELGGRPGQHNEQMVKTLYSLLDNWFPGSAQQAQAQVWKGARPSLPDGAPVLGASGAPGVWLNLGHGDSGWALACGSARLLADLMVGRDAAVDANALSARRLRP